MKTFKYVFERSVCRMLLKTYQPIRRFDIKRFSQFYKRYMDRSEGGTLQLFCEEYFGKHRNHQISYMINKHLTRRNRLKLMLNSHIAEIRNLLCEMGFRISKHKS